MTCSKTVAVADLCDTVGDSRAAVLFKSYLTGNTGPDFIGTTDTSDWQCPVGTDTETCAYHNNDSVKKERALYDHLQQETDDPLEIAEASFPGIELLGAETNRPVRFVNTEFRGDIQLSGKFESDVTLLNCDVRGDIVLDGVTAPDPDSCRIDLSFTVADWIQGTGDKLETQLVCRHSTFETGINFEGVALTGQVDFSNACIAGPALFRDSSFSDRAQFCDAEFEHGAASETPPESDCPSADFLRTTFGTAPELDRPGVDFSGTTFDATAVFTHAEFPSRASFTDTEFQDAAFRQATFIDDSGLSATVAADFSNSQVNREACFYGAEFENGARFVDSNFYGHTTFTEAAFRTTSGSTFRSKAEFERSEFHEETFFSDCVFEDEGEFSDTDFDSLVDFSNASFESKADFEEATFSATAKFVGSSFGHEAQRNYEDEAEFSKTEFYGIADFSTAQFAAKADFEGAKFDELASFWQVEFGLDEGSVFEYCAEFVTVEFDRLECFASTFRDPVNFSASSFDREARFDESDFGESVEFGVVDESKAIFKDGAYFVDATFGGETAFTSTRFDDEAVFTRSKFLASTDFDAVRFGDEIQCSSASFENDTAFENDTIFDSGGQFEHTHFQGEVTFDVVTFGDTVRFTDSTFDKPVRFADQSFGGAVDLSGTDIDYLWARETDFTLQLEGATVHGGDLRYAVLHESDFSDSTLTDFHLEGTDLRQCDIAGTDFQKVRIDDETKLLGRPSALTAGASDPGSEGLHSIPISTLLSALGVHKQRAYNDPYANPEVSDGGEAAESHHGAFSTWRELSGTDSDAAKYRKTVRDRAKKAYKKIERLAEDASRPSLQATAFLRRQDLTTKQHLDDILSSRNAFTFSPFALGRWLRSRAARIVMLYGESPWRILFWSGFIVVASAAIYDFGGYMDVEGSGELSFLDAVYYSSLIYTSLGFGDFSIVDDVIGRAVATTETLLGLTMLALLVFVLGRRASR